MSPPPHNFYFETLGQLAAIPTASFHEENVCKYILDFLNRYAIPYTIDPYGNIIAHYQKGPKCRPIALVAHTDHPAFELINSESVEDYPGANWTALLLGGVGAEWFQNITSLVIFADNDIHQPIKATLLGAKRIGRDLQLYLKATQPDKVSVGNFGVWDLPDFELRDDFVHARVIDDLVGCAASMLTLWKLQEEQLETDVYGVFTRAEEVGLVGAKLVFEQKLLPPDTFIISLEASKTLPGAVQGQGPVIRVGDRGFTFSEEAEFVLKKAAEILQANSKVKIQRQLMSGGYCEASTAIRQGYAATGLAFPLGNYHNMGSDFTLQPENIHQQDFLTGIILLQEAARLLPNLDQYVDEENAKATMPPAFADRLLANPIVKS